VVCAATDALAVEGFGDIWGADADHLKTHDDVDVTADAGFVFFTIDPSEHVDQQADSYDSQTLAARFDLIKSDIDWVEKYQGKTIDIPAGPTIEFDKATLCRAAVKYGKAIVHAIELADYIKQVATKRSQPYEIELSVDETDQPTTLGEHYIIADRCRAAGMKLVSLAPRFMGDLEKGVDYKGDLARLEKSLADHTAIAWHLGPYRLSLHSGSDKVSMYQLFARATGGLFHVKTAGTSYLEALRAVARHDDDLFRRIIDFSRDRFDTDKATYRISATVEGVPAPKDIAEAHQLEQIYLECWDDVAMGKGFTNPGRQILHCTFGSVLTDSTFGPAAHQIIREHPDTYRQVLCDHFVRHLQALTSGM